MAAAAGLRIGTKTRSDLHSVARTDRNSKRYFVTTPAETAPSRRAKNSDHSTIRFQLIFSPLLLLLSEWNVVGCWRRGASTDVIALREAVHSLAGLARLLIL